MIRPLVLLLAAFLAAGIAPAAQAVPDDTNCALSATALYERVSPAVVSITATSVNAYGRERISHVSGSGVIIDSSGLVLTNAHVVFGRQAIRVTLDDGSVVPGRVVGADPVTDLAIVRLPKPPAPLQAAPIGNSDVLRVGEEVYALGNPFGLDQTITSGIVSAINRVVGDLPLASSEPMIQTDAPINPGNSGGPLINMCGEIVGITTAIIPDSNGIGFAIPSALVKEILPKLLKDGRVIRPWFGVQGQLVTPDLQKLFRLPLVPGMLVEVVEPGSPADGAGLVGGQLEVLVSGNEVLLGGDIITAINGHPIGEPEQLTKALAALRVGSTITLDLAREGKVVRATVTLPERPVLPADVTPGAVAATHVVHRGTRRAF